jgi:hypothetical protein
MRICAIALGVLIAAAAIDRAAAQSYPWCAQYGGGMLGARECGFWTLQQCQETVSGIGGFCFANPWYAPPPKAKKRSRRKR